MLYNFRDKSNLCDNFILFYTSIEEVIILDLVVCLSVFVIPPKLMNTSLWTFSCGSGLTTGRSY